MKVTGATAIVKSLLAHQVELLFGYPGGAIMPTYDALYDFQHQLRHILVRHEQGAVHAAVGYARATGKTGVCIATSGPGATNLITGIADAMSDSVPLVCITGQVGSQLLGSDAFQEADIIGMTVPVTKWNYQVTCAEEIPATIAKAFHLASSGRPGPVLIDITKDAQFGSCTYQENTPCFPAAMLPPLLPQALQQAADLINQAKQPYLFIGQGILLAEAETKLRQLAEHADIPVASTLLGLSAFPSQHPLFKGMLGMHGNYAANILSNQADVVLAVGMRFDDRVTGDLSSYLKQAQVIHIDIDQAELNKNVRATVALQADAKTALQALLPLIEKKQHPQWQQRFAAHHAEETQQIIVQETQPQTGSIKMAEVIHQITEKTKGSALIVSDVGQHQMIAARYYQFQQTKSHISSGGLGTMGFALPAAIGAKLGAQHRQVIAIIGDGGFQMNIQELAVLAQEDIAVKIIILNNEYLGMVRQWQELFFEKRYSFTTLKNPDFVAIAQAYNIAAAHVMERETLDSALDDLLQAETSYLLNICVEKQDNVFPMVASGASVSDVRLQ